jgi:hypothetical protein
MLKEFKFLSNPIDRVFYFTVGFNSANLVLYYNGDMDDMSIHAIIYHMRVEYDNFIVGDLIRAKMECEMNQHLQGISILNER